MQIPKKEERAKPDSYDTTTTAEDTAVDMARKEGFLGKNHNARNEVVRTAAGEPAEAFTLLLAMVSGDTPYKT